MRTTLAFNRLKWSYDKLWTFKIWIKSPNLTIKCLFFSPETHVVKLAKYLHIFLVNRVHNNQLQFQLPLQNIRSYMSLHRIHKLQSRWPSMYIRKSALTVLTVQKTVLNQKIPCFGVILATAINSLKAKIAIIWKPDNWFAVQINWLVSIWCQLWRLLS